LGVVSDHLRGLVQRQVKERGIVVWFDPEGHYQEFADDLSLPETIVEMYEGSYFELRHRIELHLGADKDSPPRLVVYVPEAEEDTHNALVEVTEPGVVMKPGQHSVNLNTRLAVVAKRALRPVLGDQQTARIEKDVAAGKLTLADLDRLTTDRSELVALVFGMAYPQDVALKFLGSERYDAKLESRSATGDLAALLGVAFDISLLNDASCEELRVALARHVLSTEFVRTISDPLPPELSSANVAEEELAAEACVALAYEWRNRRDLRECYADHADRVEDELGVGRLKLGMEQVKDCETFATVELALQTALEEWVPKTPEWTPEQHRDLRDLISRRLQGFWASWPERYPQIHPRWLLIESAVEVIQIAGRIEADLKTLDGQPEEILRRYADDLSAEEPWCELDTHHRRLERRDLDFARGIGEEYGALDKLVARARRRYREAAEILSEHYLSALQKTRFEVPGIPRQTETFARHVAPALEKGKVAYLLVDSLRYEMARDLAQALESDYEVVVSPALGTVPTITEIGMAALMPGAESGAKVVEVSDGKLGLEVGGTVLRERKDRVACLQQWGELASKTVYEIKLMDLLLFSPTKKLKTAVKEADLVFVTSQEIDEQGELGNIPTARQFMDQVLSWLPRAIKLLADLGSETIILVSDHGYVFGEELDTDMKIDPPGGQTSDLHRRVWVGVGGSREDTFLRVPLSRMGLAEHLDVAVPWGFGAFKAPGGANAYFHGGMSPQEMAIPIVSLTPKHAAEAAPSADLSWELALNSKKISTRFLTVQVEGRVENPQLLKPALPRVQVEVRVSDAIVSEPVAATYGFSETALDIGMRLEEGGEIEPNTVTLMVDPDKDPAARGGVASVRLLDSTTGVELARRDDVEVDISV
jgi:hypothetical protein